MARHFLGVVAYQQGAAQHAIASIGKAIALRPDDAAAQVNLGLALHALERFQEAVESYRKAVAINSHIAEAHSNLGNAFHSLGRLAEAVASFRQALEIKSAYAEAHYNLGNAFKGLERLNEAVASYDKSLDINPNDARTHNKLGFALQGMARVDEAVASYRKAHKVTMLHSSKFSLNTVRTYPLCPQGGDLPLDVMVAIADTEDQLVNAVAPEDFDMELQQCLTAEGQQHFWRAVRGCHFEPGADPGRQHNSFHSPYPAATAALIDGKPAPRALPGRLARPADTIGNGTKLISTPSRTC